MWSYGVMGPGYVLPLKVLVSVTDRLGLLFYHYGKDPNREIYRYILLPFPCSGVFVMVFQPSLARLQLLQEVNGGIVNERCRDQCLLCWPTEA